MKFCLSQFRADTSFATNVARHIEVLERASKSGCGFVLFPELSLTGYEPTRARAQALLGADDPGLGPLQSACDALDLTVVCGAPLECDAGVEIGSLVFVPNLPPRSYAKQHLHADEEPFFVPGAREMSIRIPGHQVAPSICYESILPGHVRAAVARGATLYAASVAKPEAAIENAHVHYAQMARGHRLPIIVANAVGFNDGFVSAGRSAAWRSDGSLVAALPADVSGELIVEL